MTKAGIVEACTDPALMRVASPTAVKYIPDVFFKYKNEYNIMVQEAAKPTFPVEYLLISVISFLISRAHTDSPRTPLPSYLLMMQIILKIVFY
jgi:hypothetical protein